MAEAKSNAGRVLRQPPGAEGGLGDVCRSRPPCGHHPESGPSETGSNAVPPLLQFPSPSPGDHVMALFFRAKQAQAPNASMMNGKAALGHGDFLQTKEMNVLLSTSSQTFLERQPSRSQERGRRNPRNVTLISSGGQAEMLTSKDKRLPNVAFFPAWSAGRVGWLCWLHSPRSSAPGGRCDAESWLLLPPGLGALPGAGLAPVQSSVSSSPLVSLCSCSSPSEGV